MFHDPRHVRAQAYRRSWGRAQRSPVFLCWSTWEAYQWRKIWRKAGWRVRIRKGRRTKPVHR